MYIKAIQWLDEQEANVVISDGHFDVRCFVSPFQGKVGGQVDGLHSIDTVNVMIAEMADEKITLLCDGSISVIGKLMDRERQIIQVGEILIIIDDDCIPKDIQEGSFITFLAKTIHIY